MNGDGRAAWKIAAASGSESLKTEADQPDIVLRGAAPRLTAYYPLPPLQSLKKTVTVSLASSAVPAADNPRHPAFARSSSRSGHPRCAACSSTPEHVG